MEKIQETKPFYLTSEFWVSAGLQILLWIGALPTDGAPSWAKTAISAAGVVAYALSRGVAKSGPPFKVLSHSLLPEEVDGQSEGVKHENFHPPTEAEVQAAKGDQS
jgi:hypothetical protein